MTIKDYIKKNDLNDLELARTIGVSRQLLKAWCYGFHTPHLTHALKIFEVTNGDVTYKEMLSTSDKKKSKGVLL